MPNLLTSIAVLWNAPPQTQDGGHNHDSNRSSLRRTWEWKYISVLHLQVLKKYNKLPTDTSTTIEYSRDPNISAICIGNTGTPAKSTISEVGAKQRRTK